MNARTVADFRERQRVQAHPVTNAWLSGDRFGTVVKLGRTRVHVHMDVSGRTLRFAPDLVEDA